MYLLIAKELSTCSLKIPIIYKAECDGVPLKHIPKRPDTAWHTSVKQKALVDNAGRDELRKRIDDISTFFREQPTVITEYDEQFVQRLVEKVTVFMDTFNVEFKSGVTMDVDG